MATSPQQDFSHEVEKERPVIIRAIFVFFGSVSLVLGIIGIAVPILPTTPFILLATYLYGKSSHRFYNWIMNQAIVGKYIRQWRKDRSISLGIKILAISLVCITISTSVLFFIQLLVLKILLIMIALLIITFILRIKTNSSN